MKCKQCNKKFKFNNKSVRLYYFNKTIYFCSKNCYYEYSKNNHPSYWKWIRTFYNLSDQQKEKYHKSLKRVKNQIKKLKEKYGDTTQALHARHDLIWSKPIKPRNSFNHVSGYKSFKDFKKAVIQFLKSFSFNDLDFQFACSNDYQLEEQKIQIKAINKVFDQLYGKNKVRWGFISQPDYDKEFFWGPYLVIDEEKFFYHPSSKVKLDTFIRRKLKNEKISKKER